jgi:hypothetical protein
VLHFSGSSQDNYTRKTAAQDGVCGRNDDSKPVHCTSYEKLECHTGAGDDDCTMAVIPVTLKSMNGVKAVRTYAFLDPGSNISFCSEDIARQLGISGRSMKIKLDTMGVAHKLNTHMIEGLEVAGLNSYDFIELPKVYTKENMWHEHIFQLLKT